MNIFIIYKNNFPNLVKTAKYSSNAIASRFLAKFKLMRNNELKITAINADKCDIDKFISENTNSHIFYYEKDKMKYQFEHCIKFYGYNDLYDAIRELLNNSPLGFKVTKWYIRCVSGVRTSHTQMFWPMALPPPKYKISNINTNYYQFLLNSTFDYYDTKEDAEKALKLL